MEESKIYTTDGKVKHYTKDEEINIKLSKIIGKKFVEYRKLWNAVNEFRLETKFPIFLHLDMNQNCNLKCPHCILNQKKYFSNYYKGSNINWSEYKRIIDEGKDYSCPSMSPQGNNEPLLNKDIDKYIKYASDRGFIDIMINTNALLLTEEMAKKLLDSGLTRIRFSIDAATAKTYNKIRPGGDYDKIIANVYKFLKLKKSMNYTLPIIGVNFCKMNINEHELNEFHNYWKDIVDIITVQTFVPPILEKDFSVYYASDQYIKKRLKNFKCPQPFQRVVVRNKDITPCCAMFSSKIKIGEIGKDSIFKAWNSSAMKRLRMLHKNGDYKKNKICSKCVELIYPIKK